MAKHIFVTGGVVSALGKGITAASLGQLLKSRGYKVTMQKMDPYLNIDPGTMSPFQHGEVFVTEDGLETDLDLGHYERFIDENLTHDSNVTQGSIYMSLLNKERHGDFLGGTVQVIPHVTNAIKDRIKRLAEQTSADVVITEIGGTVGDIESQPFLEAARQFRKEQGYQNVAFVHCTLVPYIAAAHELKTKPTQHSVKELQSIGIQPDFLVLRSDHEIPDALRDKIAMFCDLNTDEVFACEDADSIYVIPPYLHAQGFDSKVCKRLGLAEGEPDLTAWNHYLDKAASTQGEVKVGIVGKYTDLPDAYLSVIEAVRHAGVHAGVEAEPILISGEDLTADNVDEVLGEMDAILVPGGFGLRAFEGKILAAKYARENKVPFLGICLGLQTAVCEYARNVAGMPGASSAEFADDLEFPVIDIMAEQADLDDLGGTMRLGAYPCKIMPGSLAEELYGEPVIYERHRHRYEVNNRFRQQLIDAGLVIGGVSPNERLVEMIELPRDVHPYYIASQGHPEFKSRPTRCHPLFKGLVEAAKVAKGM